MELPCENIYQNATTMTMTSSFYIMNNFGGRLSEIRRSFSRKTRSSVKPEVPDKPTSEKLEETAEAAPPTPQGRRRHAREAPYIKSSEYGLVKFEFTNKGAIGFIDETGKTMTLVDLFEHMIVFGGSGTGKTYSILQPLWEEWFRSTHLPDGPERDAKRFGALVVEAKGDFRDKTWSLSQKYGRMDDCVYFGPSHRDVVYNMFGDPSESPLQKSNKILEILKAFSGGKSGSDPFWDNAARKLFLNTFILHGYITEALKNATTDQERELFKIDPMSFQLLNILLMDRGQPRNAGEVNAAQLSRDAMWDKYENACRILEVTCKRIDVTIRGIEPGRVKFFTIANQRQDAYERMLETPEDEMTEDAMAALEKLGAEVQADKETLGAIHMILESVLGAEKEGETFGDDCASLRADLRGLLNADDDRERGKFSTHSREKSKEMDREAMRRVTQVDIVAALLPEFAPLKELFMDFADAAEQMRSFLEKVIKMKIPEVQLGALQSMLKQYEELLKAANKPQQLDLVWAYFREEYLNVANDKTSGSVAMVASNLVSLFVHPPFSEIFSPKGTFNFNKVIDEGQIVYLDMPTAYYGATATVAMLVMKIDFFRCMLSRPRLHKRDEQGNYVKELVNQTRPMVYFCDEFASVVTTGDETGEAGFLDKVREFKCSCILGTQSIPMLLKKIQDNEVDAILTNTAIKIFLRNTDIKTNEFASKLLGMKTKVNANLSQGALEGFLGEGNRPIGSRGFSTSYSREARYDLGDFTKLVKGQAIVCINPRFGANQIQKLNFKGIDIPKPDETPGWGVPVTHIE